MINLKHKIWSCILFLNQSPKGLDSHAVEEECQGIHIGNQTPDVSCSWQDLLLIFLIYTQKIRNLLLLSTIYNDPHNQTPGRIWRHRVTNAKTIRHFEVCLRILFYLCELLSNWLYVSFEGIVEEMWGEKSLLEDGDGRE